MSAESDLFGDCVGVLVGDQNPRVWSLIVTLFGDLAQSEEDRVSGALLTRIGQLVGIKPEAMRVALHRLRRDGWIDSQRAGRSSDYFLTRHGRRESARASPRIYASEDVPTESPTVLVAEPGRTVAEAVSNLPVDGPSVIQVGSGIAILPHAYSIEDQPVLAMAGSNLHIPGWLKKRLIDSDLSLACDRLLGTLKNLDRMKPTAQRLTPLQVAVLRTLIVHGWRRVRLRQPDLPDRFFPESWAGPETRRLVMILLEQLPRPRLDLLEAAIASRTDLSQAPA